MLDALTLAADDWSLEKLRERLGDRLEAEGRSTLRIEYVDTFDWRLHGAGCLLTREHKSGRTVIFWRSSARPFPYAVPTDHTMRFAHDLPDGFLRSELLRLSGVRALLIVGTARVTRHNARVLDSDGNTVARLVVEETIPLDASNRAAEERLKTVTIQPVGSARRAYQRAIRHLRDSGATEQPPVDVLSATAALRGRCPGDYCAKPRLSIRPDKASGKVMRMILGRLQKTVAANVSGVIDDVDVEFLHDFRVACRRARAALSQIKKVLPQPQADHLATELRWLGEVTNPCRDLDVYLLEMDGYRRQLGDSADTINDFEKLLRRERSRALRRVRRALRSKRFGHLMEDWVALVDSRPSASDAPNAKRPISKIASRKIHKAYRRMVKRGVGLSDPPPAEDLHRLRIDAKKLRYLLEFFGSLWPKKTTARLVKELKQFQDILGGSNDMAVQQRHLAVFAETLMAEGSTQAGTVFAMGRLADAMAARQETYAQAFAERFELFAGEASRELYHTTFGGD
jgi:CHAD domain-containing protein